MGLPEPGLRLRSRHIVLQEQQDVHQVLAAAIHTVEAVLCASRPGLSNLLRPSCHADQLQGIRKSLAQEQPHLAATI